MQPLKTIAIYEHQCLIVGEEYGNPKNSNSVKFEDRHYRSLAKYYTLNPECPFYTVYFNRIRFCNFIGVIRVEDITIEVLPKTDNGVENKELWQEVLLQMLKISLQVEAKTTNPANIHIRQHSVLETYLGIFIDEVQLLIHAGLVKKYRKHISNQTAMKGKLLVHQHITKNLVHAERFFVAHQVYDRDNIYNAVLQETLFCIGSLNISDSLNKRCQSVLVDFPECKRPKVSEKLFQRLIYDRKTERYKPALALARIILLNYHPDLKGGQNNILAIMFDMNLLWERFIYWTIKRASQSEDYPSVTNVSPQSWKYFWQPDHGWSNTIRPDIVIEMNGKPIIVDTKWKYNKKTSVEDVRQMYAYNKYWKAKHSYLLYPGNFAGIEKVESETGNFHKTGENDGFAKHHCGLLKVDLLKDGELNKEIGEEILAKIIIEAK